MGSLVVAAILSENYLIILVLTYESILLALLWEDQDSAIMRLGVYIKLTFEESFIRKQYPALHHVGWESILSQLDPHGSTIGNSGRRMSMLMGLVFIGPSILSILFTIPVIPWCNGEVGICWSPMWGSINAEIQFIAMVAWVAAIIGLISYFVWKPTDKLAIEHQMASMLMQSAPSVPAEERNTGR